MGSQKQHWLVIDLNTQSGKFLNAISKQLTVIKIKNWDEIKTYSLFCISVLREAHHAYLGENTV